MRESERAERSSFRFAHSHVVSKYDIVRLRSFTTTTTTTSSSRFPFACESPQETLQSISTRLLTRLPISRSLASPPLRFLTRVRSLEAPFDYRRNLLFLYPQTEATIYASIIYQLDARPSIPIRIHTRDDLHGYTFSFFFSFFFQFLLLQITDWMKQIKVKAGDRSVVKE